MLNISWWPKYKGAFLISCLTLLKLSSVLNRKVGREGKDYIQFHLPAVQQMCPQEQLHSVRLSGFQKNLANGPHCSQTSNPGAPMWRLETNTELEASESKWMVGFVDSIPVRGVSPKMWNNSWNNEKKVHVNAYFNSRLQFKDRVLGWRKGWHTEGALQHFLLQRHFWITSWMT